MAAIEMEEREIYICGLVLTSVIAFRTKSNARAGVCTAVSAVLASQVVTKSKGSDEHKQRAWTSLAFILLAMLAERAVAVRRWLIERRKGQEFLRRERRLAELVPAIEQIKAELSTRRAEIAAAEKGNSTLKAAVKAKDKRNALEAALEEEQRLDKLKEEYKQLSEKQLRLELELAEIRKQKAQRRAEIEEAAEKERRRAEKEDRSFTKGRAGRSSRRPR